MTYDGTERRVRRVYVTRNTEYHMVKKRCVGVRDRRSGEWLDEHFAQDRMVSGSLRFFESGALTASTALPRPGESLYFEDAGHDLVTSAIISVERPPREVVESYPQH